MKKLFIVLLLFSFLFSTVSAEEEDDLLIEEVIEETVFDNESLLDADGSSILTITCTGDFTIGGDTRKQKRGVDIFNDELKKQGGDINFPMREMRNIFLSDDLTLINFEGTLTESTYVPSSKKENQFLFSAPPSYVSMLSNNGVEAVSLENNHVMDHGEEVYAETQQTLEDAGIVWSNSEHLGEYTVKGITVAMLSYLCIDRYQSLWEQVPKDIAKAKEYYPLVIVSFHWGNEKDYVPTANQIKMGRLAVDSGADLVIGHHSHRMNPIELYNGVYICYSLGNFCFAGNKKPDDMSSFVFQIRFKVKDGAVSSKGFRIIPIRISSRADYNDFIPTPYTDGSHIDAVLSTLKSNGKKLEYAVSSYPTEWQD